LISKGKVSQAQNVYRRDPAWARGLISAAQSVAGSVGDLVTSANTAAQGNAEQEALVASAKGVAAATARLVFASRAKADPFSPAQQKLSAAAKSVAAATQQLVIAAQSTAAVVEEEKPEWESNQSAINARKMEIEQQTKILKLQKELQSAQTELGKIRKAEYVDSTQPPVKLEAKRAQAQIPRTNPSGSSNPISTPTPAFAVKTVSKGSGPMPVKASGRQLPKVNAAPIKESYTLEELQTKPRELDGSRLEMYLADDIFYQLFGMDKQSYANQPEWKRNADKAKYGLF